ncbi:MAG: CvpA family protein [Kiritimatiellia bacterium]
MLPQSLTTVDAIVIALIAIGAVQGLLRGLSGEMARLLGALCAFVAGALLHEPLGLWVANYTRLVDQQARTFTYVLTVILALVLWAFFHKIIRKMIQMILSTGFDKSAGVPAGMLRMTTWTGIIFIIMNIWPNIPLKEQFNENSFFGRQFIRLVPAVQRQMEAMNVTIPENNATRENPADDQHTQEEIAP